MMFVDEAEIVVEAGHGGTGKVSFFSKKGGPSGGNGGKGGDVYITLSNNLSSLYKYIEKTVYKAENGGFGGSNRKNGKNGSDLFLQVPNNTTIIDLGSHEKSEINNDTPQLRLCYGGKGGLGNDALKSPINRTPRKATPGYKGEKRHLKLIMKLIADYGLIGLPNAGKSSLLNVLTAANVKTANYPFTTLEPNLGVFNTKVIADVPGLIEGASKGKGLGIKFLKHIEKVSLLFHCLAVDSETIENDYQMVINELGNYSDKLLSKNSIILLTKIDLVNKEVVDKRIKQLQRFNKQILPVSIYDRKTLEPLKKIINQA